VKKVFVVAAIVGALWFARNQFFPSSTGGSWPSFLASILPGSKSPEKVVKERFEKFMQSWKEGGVSLNNAEQAAACLWSRGVVFINNVDELRDAAEGFDRWRKGKGLYVQEIRYEVGEYRRDGDHTVVEVTINGSRSQVGIPDTANPMFWTE